MIDFNLDTELLPNKKNFAYCYLFAIIVNFFLGIYKRHKKRGM
jgi:hypothetical protein